MDTPTTQTIPAERIKEGVGFQVVNVLNREGEYVRQLRCYGTEEQARARAEIGLLHDTNPRWRVLRKIILGH
ncbi:hypothetical protein ACFYY8_31445 [Streptosporangium sp. NPDC001559]|uniref:hypothetical protein n=1 Tax=Streptosporangium sp. NPDC001559 TaxID=3366187 RepID=UPI0036DFE74C